MNRTTRISLAILIATMFILLGDATDNTMNTFSGQLNVISWILILSTYSLSIGIAWDED